jgi:lipoate-protein ligase A
VAINLDPNWWRLVSTSPGSGAWNMAVDEAILHAVAEEHAAPTLRLYAWEPACLSLGHAQPLDDIDQERLAEKGWELVRRPTGGRAILHHRELTYAVVAREDHPIMQGGVLESYRRISKGLVKFLEELALAVEVRGSQSIMENDRSNPICFEVPSAYEITVAGRKLIGSAQVRRRKSVLQHGSLPLTGNISEICEVLRYPDELRRDAARTQVRQRAATLEDALGTTMSWSQAAQAFKYGFERALDIKFQTAELSPDEMVAVERLQQEQYLNPSWTQRVMENRSTG